MPFLAPYCQDSDRQISGYAYFLHWMHNFRPTVALFGFQPLSYSAAEGETVDVTVVLLEGILDGEITINVGSSDINALGKSLPWWVPMTIYHNYSTY